MRRVAVICPNIREFELDAEDKFSRYPGYRMTRSQAKVFAADVEYFLVSDSRHLRGKLFQEVQKWGRWYQMPGVDRLIDEAWMMVRRTANS